MFKHSLIYRLLSGSLILGWLVSAPEEAQNDRAAGSCIYHLSSRWMDAILNCLYKIGAGLARLMEASMIVSNAASLAGILVFIGLAWDIAGNDHGLFRTLTEAVLALGCLAVPLAIKVPGFVQGSLAWSFLRWWENSD